jgi:hypothetical protein
MDQGAQCKTNAEFFSHFNQIQETHFMSFLKEQENNPN